MEFSIRGYRILSNAQELPFNIADANNSFKYDNDNDNDKEKLQNNVTKKTRLDNRWVDLRCYNNQLVMRCKSNLCKTLRDILHAKEFTEIFTPKLTGTASEGGADVYETMHFGTKAYLAQSPQLYKQMCINGGMGKVFEIAPIFRHDNSISKRHLSEYIGIDLEMELIRDVDGKYTHMYVVNTAWDMLYSVFSLFGEQKDTKSLFEKLETSPPVVPKEPCVITFEDGVKMLNNAGYDQKHNEDLNTENEHKLGELVRDKTGSDLFVLTEYPKNARPFYTCPHSTDPEKTLSFDIILRGNEISSGARRINNYNMLLNSLMDHNLDPNNLKGYVESFKHGSPPHGGCGFGLERIVMLYFNLANVKRVATFPRDPKRLFP